jgi:hypothetical protein
MIFPQLWPDLARRVERVRNLLMRKVFTRFASINEFERQVRSQNGEDGIVEELLRRIGDPTRYFAEFGVTDGAECNTAYLAECGWSGLMLEGDPERFARLSKNYAGMPKVRLDQRFVTAENIADVFATSGVPVEFDVLSIDIDGNDYWLWQALRSYRPRVVVVEYNAAYPPPELFVMPYDPAYTWDKTSYFGASLASFEALGLELGYALLGTEKKGVNAFFVRKDLVPATQFPVLDAARAYHPFTYGPPYKPGPAPKVC